LFGTLKERLKRLWRRATISIWLLLGNLKGVSSNRGFESCKKVELEMGRLSLKRLNTEDLEGGLLSGTL
jgi:hypothetical protein